ncbi:uroporphyrinogen-III synthase [Rheinheimera sp. UJ51]|uniref:uroporphyrinogen-III synthase n=1 Tax=Rheinheimera sp. UJ51 TaxID=2892446 RepID=UPI001E394E4D|nr:uroporphyrinogen-III synthase [Rheinheimera sp. UJ51]MCC5452278.1 uroporphyrinogen-III synthase [Rheinheimera sp. UJ51]
MFLITRPAGKADHLLESLDSYGIPYLYQPVITTQMVQLKPKDIRWLEQADSLIFVSISAVNTLEQQVTVKQLPGRLFAVGATTGAALQRWTGRQVIIPEDQRSEGLLALPELNSVAEQQVVVVRGNGGRELIKQTLVQRGATVRYVQSYSRLPLPLDGAQLKQQWQQQGVQCIVATSNEILQRIFGLVPTEQHAWLAQQHWILVSPRARDSALALGIPLQHIHLASSANDDALLEAVTQFKRNIL